MASDRDRTDRLPLLSLSTDCLVARTRPIRRGLASKSVPTSLPLLNKTTTTNRRRRGTTYFSAPKVAARRQKSALIRWIAVNRKKYKRGKQPLEPSLAILKLPEKLRYLHFIHPLALAQGRQERRKQIMQNMQGDRMPLCVKRVIRNRREWNPFVRIGGGYRQGFIRDPNYWVPQNTEDDGSLSAFDGSLNIMRESVIAEEVGLAEEKSGSSVASKGSSKQGKKQSRKLRRKNGEIVEFEGTDLSGVEEEDDVVGERMLPGAKNKSDESYEQNPEEKPASSSLDLSQDDKVFSDGDGGVRLSRHGRKRQDSKTRRRRSEDGEGRRKRTSKDAPESGEESAGGKRQGTRRRRMRQNKSRHAGDTDRRRRRGGDDGGGVGAGEEDEEDDGGKGVRRGSPRRRRRKGKHGDKVSSRHAKKTSQSGLESPSEMELRKETSQVFSNQSEEESEEERFGERRERRSRSDVETESSQESADAIRTEDDDEDNDNDNDKDNSSQMDQQQASLTAEGFQEVAVGESVKDPAIVRVSSSAAGRDTRRNSERPSSSVLSSVPVDSCDSDAGGKRTLRAVAVRGGKAPSARRSQVRRDSPSLSSSDADNIPTALSHTSKALDERRQSIGDISRKISQEEPTVINKAGDQLETPAAPGQAVSPCLPSSRQGQASLIPNETLLDPETGGSLKRGDRRRRSQSNVSRQSRHHDSDSSSDSDRNVMNERKMERQRRRSRRDLLRPDAGTDQEAGGRSSAAPESAQGRERRRRRRSSDQRRPSNDRLSAEPADTRTPSLSARQRRVGVDYSTSMTLLKPPQLDTVPSSDVCSSVVSSVVNGVKSLAAPVQVVESVSSAPAPDPAEANWLQTEAIRAEARQSLALPRAAGGARRLKGRNTYINSSEEGDVDDDDASMPRETPPSSPSGIHRYPMSLPSVSTVVSRQPPNVVNVLQGNPSQGPERSKVEVDKELASPSHHRVQYYDYLPPGYSKGVDSDSTGEPLSSPDADPGSVFAIETEDQQSYISNVSFHRDRRSVATNRSRDPRARRRRGLHGGVASTSSVNSGTVLGASVQPTVALGASQLEVPSVVRSVSTKRSTSPSGESSSSQSSIAHNMTVPVPAAAQPTYASSVVSSSIAGKDAESVTSGTSRLQSSLRLPRLRRDEVRAADSVAPSAVKGGSSSVPALPALDAFSSPVVGAGKTSYRQPSRSFRRFPMRSRSSSLSGSADSSESEDRETVSDAGDDEKTDVADDSSVADQIARSGIGSVRNVAPLKRNPWEEFNKKKKVQRTKAQIQIRADEVLMKVQADFEDSKQKFRDKSAVDYLARFHIVDRSKMKAYARAFAAEDEDEDGVITFDQLLLALETIPSTNNISRKQLNYALKVLDLEDAAISFKMFAVTTAVSERICALDNEARKLMEGLDMTQVARRFEFYKRLFVGSDEDVKKSKGYKTFVDTDLLKIELKAGGVSQRVEDQVVRRCDPSNSGKVWFLDYLAYIPLFIHMHGRICDNPLNAPVLGPIRRSPSPEEPETPQIGSLSSLPAVSSARRASLGSVSSSFIGSNILRQARAHLKARASLAAAAAGSASGIGNAHSVSSVIPEKGDGGLKSQSRSSIGSSTGLTPSGSQASLQDMKKYLMENMKGNKYFSESADLKKASSIISRRQLNQAMRSVNSSESTDRKKASSIISRRHPSQAMLTVNSSSDSSRPSSTTRRTRKRGTSIRSERKSTMTAMDRLLEIAHNAETKAALDSDVVSSEKERLTSSPSPPLESSVTGKRTPTPIVAAHPLLPLRSPGRVVMQTKKMLSVQQAKVTNAAPSVSEPTAKDVVRRVLGKEKKGSRLPSLPRRRKFHSSEEMSPSPQSVTDTSARSSPTNSIFSSKHASLVTYEVS